jgi:hypothetical protein
LSGRPPYRSEIFNDFGVKILSNSASAINRSNGLAASRELRSVTEQKLRKDGPCSLDDVALYLSPFYSWEEVSLAVDRMSRDGRLLLCQLGHWTYQISLASQISYSSSTS